MKILNIRHIGIKIDRHQDFEPTKEYWRLLGCEVVSDGYESWNGQKLHIAKLAAPGGMIIELVEGNWKDHIAVTVDQFEEGRKPTVRPDGRRVLFGLAPDRTRVEFVEEKKE